MMKIELSDELWAIIKLFFIVALIELLGWGIYEYLSRGDSADWGDTPLFVIMLCYFLLGGMASSFIIVIFEVIRFLYENINFENK